MTHPCVIHIVLILGGIIAGYLTVSYLGFGLIWRFILSRLGQDPEKPTPPDTITGGWVFWGTLLFPIVLGLTAVGLAVAGVVVGIEFIAKKFAWLGIPIAAYHRWMNHQDRPQKDIQA